MIQSLLRLGAKLAMSRRRDSLLGFLVFTALATFCYLQLQSSSSPSIQRRLAETRGQMGIPMYFAAMPPKKLALKPKKREYDIAKLARTTTIGVSTSHLPFTQLISRMLQ